MDHHHPRADVSEQKILFRLEPDEDGYPPFDIEGIWGTPKPDGTFVIDNIPFFARQVALGDVVEVVYEEGSPFYSSTVARSGNSLIRVIFYEGHDPEGLGSELREMGCETEHFGTIRLMAVSVPDTVSLVDVQACLDRGSECDGWDYEEAILRQ